MLERIDLSLFRLEVPIPGSPLQSINSYLLKTPGRNLIIDTGVGTPEAKEIIISAAAGIGMDLNRTDYFITHLHPDHIEIVSELIRGDARLYLNQREVDIVNSPGKWETYHKFSLSLGFPENELKEVEAANPIRGFQSRAYGLDFFRVKDGDVISVGDYSFQCLETPGHSPGHTCLYEPIRKILFSGDHILFDITPNITSWPSMENALKQYLESLDKVYPLEVNLVLPGHRTVRTNHRQRIQELKEHHRIRAAEVLAVLGATGKTAYQIAPEVTWDVSYQSWEQFPPAQKWFAVGEVSAHLRYLEGEGRARSQTENGIALFYRSAFLC